MRQTASKSTQCKIGKELRIALARPQSGLKKAELIKRFEKIATNARGSHWDSPSQTFISDYNFSIICRTSSLLFPSFF